MDIKAEFSRDRFLALAQSEGLRTVGGNRFECPWRCNASKPEAKRSAKVDDSNSGALWKCHSCGKSGSVVDLLMATRSLSSPKEAFEALEQLFPHLKDVKPAAPKGPPRDARKLWESFTTNDPLGIAYLKGRKLEAAAELGLVRFNVGRSGDTWLDARSRDGLRVAMACRDSFGNVITFQMRNVAKVGPPKLSLAGVEDYGPVAFGDPTAAADAPVVYLTEGMADTMAIALGIGKTAQVLGAPGADQIKHLADLVGEPEGRTFVLCPQNDTNPKVRLPSALAFKQLAKVLEAQGADVRTLATPEGTKDPADWLAATGRERFRAAVGKPPEKALPTAGQTALQPKLAGGPHKLSTSFASICAILENPKTREMVMGAGDLEYDEKAMRPTIGRRVLEDVDLYRLRQRIELTFVSPKKRGLEFKLTDIEHAVMMISQAKRFSPVGSYLNGLKWDGVERINHIAEDIFGLNAPTQLVQTIMRRWFISAVARALWPGCKCDTVLVLVGEQRMLKSTFFSMLVPERSWFSDTAMNINNKDSYLLLSRVWVLEWAELESMQRSRDTNSKQFLSSPSDYFRAPYDRAVKDHPRSCVIVGTANPGELFSDPTGNLRYWPIEVHQRIDVKLLRAQRDQLWAEAVHYYRAKERWWLDTDEDRQLAVMIERHETRDAWETAVMAFCRRRAATADYGVETADILLEAIKKHPGTWTRADEMRVSAILRRAGWRKAQKMVDNERAYRWFPPGKAVQQDMPL